MWIEMCSCMECAVYLQCLPNLCQSNSINYLANNVAFGHSLTSQPKWNSIEATDTLSQHKHFHILVSLINLYIGLFVSSIIPFNLPRCRSVSNTNSLHRTHTHRTTIKRTRCLMSVVFWSTATFFYGRA